MEKLNKKLPEIRISTELDNKIKKALDKLNDNKFKDMEIELTKTDLRRMSYKFFAEEVLADKIGFLK